MDEKLLTLFQSRRFWAVTAGVALVLLLPFEVKLLVTILFAAWIIGDSIRATKAILLAVMFSSLAPLAIANDTHDLCRQATVRIRNGSSMGTGTVFRESTDAFYVLTNAHVAGTQLGNRVELEFWRDGHQSKPVSGDTVAVAYIPRAYRDIAVVKVPKTVLGAYSPPVIPLAGSQDSFDYQNIFSVGCPSGRWPTAFEGFALRRQANGGDTIHFVPMPAGGRSGSAIFDVQGRVPQIIGLIAWRSSDEGGHGLDGRGETHGYGIAMTHQEVWAGLSGKQTTSSLLLVPPPNSVPLGTDAPDEQLSKPQPLPDGEEDSVVLKYSDPFAIQPEVDLYMQRLPTGIPATGSDRDVMLLYQDSLSDGPQSSPPAMATDSCCPGCGCRLTASGNCPDGRCPLPQRGQPQFDNGGGGLFPSLPQRREPDQRLLPRPQELLREAFPIPTFANVLPWLIVAGFAIYLALRFAQSRFDAAVRRATDQTTPAPTATKKPRTTSRKSTS
jgi:hypothetical protein